MARVPYYFAVARPRIGLAPARHVKTVQLGDTRKGTNHVTQYRFPTSRSARRRLQRASRSTRTAPSSSTPCTSAEPVANPASRSSRPARRTRSSSHGSSARSNENDVQGYAGHAGQRERPDLRVPVRHRRRRRRLPAREALLRRGRLARRPVHGPPLRGAYVLRSWQNDVTPPRFKLLTKRRHAGPAADRGRRHRRGAGVDPLSLVIDYKPRCCSARALRPGLRARPLAARRRAEDRASAGRR